MDHTGTRKNRIRGRKKNQTVNQNRAKAEQLAPVTLQAILVTEADPPPECEPITWLLLTTLEITSLEDVHSYVRWYSYRWLIERYHYVLKSGCGVEKLQLETALRLEMALATYSIVAGAFVVADLLSSLFS